MKAEIFIQGIVRSSNSMFETQAEIIPESGFGKTVRWSMHDTLEEAEEYKRNFNNHLTVFPNLPR